MQFRQWICLLLLAGILCAQTVVDITVKGISNAQNDGAQKDREEAIVDAKRQACEKAGVAIESKATVRDFKLMSEYIETQSSGVILPGFQVIDVGYVADGTYQVVLSGKIKTKDDDPVSSRELRYARTLHDKQDYAKCRSILEKYIDSKDGDVTEEIREEAYYCFLRWGYAFNLQDEFDKFSSYYPGSRHLDALKSFVAFSLKPLCSYVKECQVEFSQWQDRPVTREQQRFDRSIPVILDTVVFTDFKNNIHSLVLEYTLLQSTGRDAKEPFALIYSLIPYAGDIRKMPPEGAVPAQACVFEYFKAYAGKEKLQYQASRSDVRFGNFKMSDYLLKGEVPTARGAFPQKAVFSISQIAF